MPGLHPRTLLRYKPGALRLSSIGTTRYLQTHLPLRPLQHRPSPIASSSRITLDHIPLAIDNDPFATALIYAQDEELVRILLDDRPHSLHPSHPDWTWGLDPSSAYLCLRTRTTFSHYLAYLAPRIESVYLSLRPSGLHRYLISDLLLRYPNPDCLQKLLLLENENKDQKQLPSSLICAIYHFLRHAAPNRASLSRSLHLSVLPALMEEAETVLLLSAYDDLSKTTIWEPEGAWVLFSILLHLSRREETDHCMKLLQKLVSEGHIPRNALGKTNIQHPEAIRIMISTVILRCCLQWKLFGRAEQVVAEDLLKIIRESLPSRPAFEILLEVCRGAIASTNIAEVEWAGAFMLEFARLDGAPSIPDATLDSYYAVAPPDACLEVYSELPRSDPESLEESAYLPSAASLIRLAQTASYGILVHRIVPDLERLPDTALSPFREILLSVLAKHGLGGKLKHYLRNWYINKKKDDDHTIAKISGPLLIRILACLLKCEVDHRFCLDLVEMYGLKCSPQQEFYLIPARLMLRDVNTAILHVKSMDLGGDSIKDLVEIISRSSVLPALATLALYNQVYPSESTPTPGSVILATMAHGQWELIRNQVHLLSPDEKRELRVMRSVAMGSFVRTLTLFESMLARNRSISQSTIRFILSEACRRARWVEGIRFWKAAISPSTKKIRRRDDQVDASDDGQIVDRQLVRLGWQYLQDLRAHLRTVPRSEVPFLMEQFASVRLEMEPVINMFRSSHHRRITLQALTRFEDTARRLAPRATDLLQVSNA